jgi:Na+/melibiose symporter-like transporter
LASLLVVSFLVWLLKRLERDTCSQSHLVREATNNAKSLWFANNITVTQVGGTFAQYFAVGDRVVFLVGKLITGLPLGAYQTLGPAYISEVMPVKLRGPTTAATIFAITFGQFLFYVAIRLVTFTPGSKAYQIMFAVQWGLAGVSFVCLYFIPESPFYFISRGNIDNARKSIAKLHGKDTDTEGRVVDIMAALRLESEGDKTSSSLAACFSKQHRRRTIITCGTFFVASQSGSTWVIGFVGYFLQLAGKTAAQANSLSLVVLGMTLVGNIFGWPLIEKCGRRPVMFWGTSTCYHDLSLGVALTRASKVPLFYLDCSSLLASLEVLSQRTLSTPRSFSWPFGQSLSQPQLAV